MGEARRERVRLSKTFRLEKVLVNLSMIEMTSSSGLRFPRFHSGNTLCHSQKILQKNTVNAMKQSDATYKFSRNKKIIFREKKALLEKKHEFL